MFLITNYFAPSKKLLFCSNFTIEANKLKSYPFCFRQQSYPFFVKKIKGILSFLLSITFFG